MEAKALALAFAAFSAALTVMAAGWGLGRIGATSVESIARQPEASGKISGAMILVAALLEGVALFSLVICFIIQNKVTF